MLLRGTIKNIYLLIVLSVIVVFEIIGCNNGVISENNNDTKNIHNEWDVYESNPIIVMGQAMTNAQWNDPSVIKVDSTYVMYLTANSVPVIGQDVIPFCATSADGINWNINTTPLLALGNQGAFDEVGIETPSVIFFNGEYHIYYTGVGSGGLGGPLSIGHAISIDGISWTKDTNNPILLPTFTPSDWNGIQVAEPGAVVFNNQVYLYFAAVGLRPGGGTPIVKRTIGVAISNDGYSFGIPQLILEQSTRYPAIVGYSGYSTPAVVVYKGQFHLFYDVVYENPEFVQISIEQATSADGINWIEDDKPVFVRSAFSWTQREIRSPSIIHDGNQFKMWFAGDDYIEHNIWGIGCATYTIANYNFY